MPLENLTIHRVCLHEVFRFGEDGNVVPPQYGGGLLMLDTAAAEAFRSRVVSAFKSNAQCMEMGIRDFGPGTVLALGADLIGVPNADFVQRSRAFADSLAGKQANRAIPGGLVVVFDGTHGHPAVPFFAIMKAELHGGFLKTNNLQARFVDDLFLSPKTKLYKIGLFTFGGIDPRSHLPQGWSAILYDSAMTASRRDNAANYFHSSYLGLEIPVNAAQTVRQFWEHTRAFIKSARISEEDKVDLYNGLSTYLKVDRSPTIQVSRFAQTYMDDVLAEDYQAHMRRERFPAAAVLKDLSEIAARLRYRRLRFPQQITLQGPPEAMANLVSVQSVETEGGQSWTQITIRGKLEAQE